MRLGLFSLVGGLIGAGKQKKASRKAQAALIASLEKGIAEQTRQYDQTRADYEPARKILDPSVTALANLIGLNGADAQQAGMQGVQDSPILASIIRNGEEGILQNGAATGGLRGGNIQNSLANFRGDAFSNELQAQMARLAGATGIGLGATDSVANFGANKANALTSLFGQQGGATASGLLQRGGITAGMFQNGGSFLDGIGKAFAPASGAGSFLSKIF